MARNIAPLSRYRTTQQSWRHSARLTEFDALGEEFETKEHQLFGKEGFEGEVEKVGEIEKQLGIYDLSKFTPQVAP